MVFFVYRDWTLENFPRVFYVGKGQTKRVHVVKRESQHWRDIHAKHGSRREVVLATKDETFAFDEEKRLIKQHRTFYGHDDYLWGANKTAGGDGSTGHTVSVDGRRRLSIRHSGVNNPHYGRCGELHPMFGMHHDEDVLERLRGNGNGRCVLTSFQVVEIRQRYAVGDVSYQDLASIYGVTRDHICKIVRRVTWKHV